VFRTVIEKGTFVRAAEALRVPQPAISAQIKSLEKELGCVLIQRRPGVARIKPTEPGEMVYEAAVKILDELEGLSLRIRSLNQHSCSLCTVRVVSDVPTGVYILSKLVSDFRRHHPEAVITLITTNFRDLPATLQEGGYDLAVVPQEISVPDASLDFTFLEDLVAVANSSLLSSPKIADWTTLPLVLPPKNTVVRKSVDPYFRELGITPNVVMELNHPEAVRKAVKTNSLAAITHRVSVEEDLVSAELVELRPPKPLPRLIYKVMRLHSRPSQHLQAFSKFLQERLPHHQEVSLPRIEGPARTISRGDSRGEG
jgi:LysR family cyn operon transcriptional activator